MTKFNIFSYKIWNFSNKISPVEIEAMWNLRFYSCTNWFMAHIKCVKSTHLRHTNEFKTGSFYISHTSCIEFLFDSGLIVQNPNNFDSIYFFSVKKCRNLKYFLNSSYFSYVFDAINLFAQNKSSEIKHCLCLFNCKNTWNKCEVRTYWKCVIKSVLNRVWFA